MSVRETTDRYRSNEWIVVLEYNAKIQLAIELKSKTKYVILLLFVWQIDNTESALITDLGEYTGRPVNTNIDSLCDKTHKLWCSYTSLGDTYWESNTNTVNVKMLSQLKVLSKVIRIHILGTNNINASNARRLFLE